MHVEIFIVTFKRDFPYLFHCLRSIQKFFDCPFVRLLVPFSDMDGATTISKMAHCPTNVDGFEEWPNIGMIHHMYQIVCADQWCKDADFILHFDADTIFTAPVSIETYVPDGKPILRYEPFESIGKRHPSVFEPWREACNKCLPFKVHNETMRAFPMVYHRGLYQMTRDLMFQKTGKTADVYVKEQRNEYPQSFCEFNTLGNVAMQMFPSLYKPVLQTSDKSEPPTNVIQFWSRGPLDKKQIIWREGRQEEVVPAEVIERIIGV